MTLKSFVVIIGLLLLLNNINHLMAQDNKFAEIANQYFEKKQYEKAITEYQKALKKDDSNAEWQYNLAMSYYRTKQYPKAIPLLEELIKEKDNKVKYYRLLANSFDLNNQYQQAVSTLQQGILKYSHSGELYLDWGVIEMLREKPGVALAQWEKGIEASPSFADNYYWLSKTYNDTNEKIWSVVYGELFVNIERGTKRADEISEILYNTYYQLIEDSSTLTKGSIKLEREQENPFVRINHRLYQVMHRNGLMNFDRAKILTGDYELKAIALIRQDFLQMWLQGFGLAYPNTLYKRHRAMYDLGFYEAYNYWLFSKIKPVEFLNWKEANEIKYGSFITWFAENPMKVDAESFMVRTQFIKPKTIEIPPEVVPYIAPDN